MSPIERQYPKNSIDAVLRLLMLTVYADEKQRHEEITEIWRQIPKFQLFVAGGYFQGATGLRASIDAHGEETQRLIIQENLPHTIEGSVRRIDDPALIPMVLQAMQAIAISDGQFHHNENAIIAQAYEIWNPKL